MSTRKKKGKALREFRQLSRSPARSLIADYTKTWSLSPSLEKIARLSQKRIEEAIRQLSDKKAPDEKKKEAEDLIISAYWATQPTQPGPAKGFPPDIFDWIDNLCTEVVEAELKRYRERKRALLPPPLTRDDLFVREVANALKRPRQEIWRVFEKAGLARRESSNEGGRMRLNLYRRRAGGIRDVLVSHLTKYSPSSLRAIRARNYNRDN